MSKVDEAKLNRLATEYADTKCGAEKIMIAYNAFMEGYRKAMEE